MRAKKYTNTKKLSISNKKVSVPPPSGYHWMEEQGRYYLMEGDYKSHSGAVEEATFKTATHSQKT
jgi:hypothetical protein